MDTIITDQGRKFVNELNDRLCELLKIRNKLTSPYHPQANSLDERFNQTFKSALEKLVNEKQNDWDVYIKHVLFAYRASVNASTKYTPFYLMFGRQAKLPIELDLPSSLESEVETECQMDTYIDTLIDIRDNVFKVASRNIKAAQEKQKRDYDRRNLVAEHSYTVGPG
jgi:transposase InsO family protein